MKQKSDLYHKIGLKKIQDMPDQAHVYYEMAIQLWEMEETDEVEQYLLKCLKLDPMHADAGVAYACFLHRQKRLADSIDQFVKVIKQHPQNAEAHLYVSSVLIEAKKYDMALHMIQMARQLKHHNEVTLLMNEGVIYLNCDDYQRAKQCYEKAIAMNPEFAPLLVNLAIAQIKLKDYDAAKKTLDRVLLLDAGDFLAHKYLGEVYFNTGKIQAALDEFLKAHDLDQKSCAVIGQVIIAAHCLKNQKTVMEFENKLRDYKREIGYQEVCERLSLLYQKQGDVEGLKRLQQIL